MICGKDAIGCYSPDLDIKGLCFCKKHQKKVLYKYWQLIYEARNKYEKNKLNNMFITEDLQFIEKPSLIL